MGSTELTTAVGRSSMLACAAAVSDAKVFTLPLAAEEHHALVEHRKPRALLSGGEGLAGDAVKIRAVDRVISPIEADRLDIHIYVKELRRPWANAQGVFYVGL